MTPKEKAIELVSSYARIDGYVDSIDLSKCEFEKQCVLIAVDEILNVIPNNNGWQTKRDYWQQVKQEIEKL